MAAPSKSLSHRYPAVVTVALAAFAINSAGAAPALKQSECEAKFTRAPVSVTTQLQIGSKEDPSYRITWRLPAQPPLSTIVRPPPRDKQIGFSFEKWQGYVDQKNQTARLSTPSGMEEVKLECRRKPFGPQKRR